MCPQPSRCQTTEVQTEFPPDYVRSRIDAFFEEHFKWLEEIRKRKALWNQPRKMSVLPSRG